MQVTSTDLLPFADFWVFWVAFEISSTFYSSNNHDTDIFILWKENLLRLPMQTIMHILWLNQRVRKRVLETVEPIGDRVLIRKDEDRKITKVGIHLPDKIEIPTL